MHATTPSPDLTALLTQLTESLTTIVTQLATTLQVSPGTLADVEAGVVPAIRDLGASLISGLCGLRTSVPTRTVTCACGQQARYQRMRSATVITVLGPIQIPRAYYLCAACHRGQAPDDAQLQIVAGSVSAGLAEVMAMLGATQDSFADAATVLARLTLVQVCPNSIRAETEALGLALVTSDTTTAAAQQDVRTCAAAAPHPAPHRPRLYVSMDGIQVHFRDPGWGELKVGCVYHTRTCPDPHHPEQLQIRLDQPSYCVRRGDPEAFASVLWQEAVRRGVLDADEVVVLGDGSAWIWGIAARQFPEATQILDWYHASSYLWDAATAIWPTDEGLRTAWIHTQRDALWDGRVTEVLSALEQHRAAGAGVATTITYYTNQQQRMAYADYRARGLQIGSGSIESACKQVVTSRLKGAGMIWDEEGAEAVATVRAYLKSGRWDEAMARRPQRQRTYARSQPTIPEACPQEAPDAAPAAPTPPPQPTTPPARRLPDAIRAQVQAELAAERAHHPWRRWQGPRPAPRDVGSAPGQAGAS